MRSTNLLTYLLTYLLTFYLPALLVRQYTATFAYILSTVSIKFARNNCNRDKVKQRHKLTRLSLSRRHNIREQFVACVTLTLTRRPWPGDLDPATLTSTLTRRPWPDDLDLDLDPATLTRRPWPGDLELKILRMYLRIKMNLLYQGFQKCCEYCLQLFTKMSGSHDLLTYGLLLSLEPGSGTASRSFCAQPTCPLNGSNGHWRRFCLFETAARLWRLRLRRAGYKLSDIHTYLLC